MTEYKIILPRKDFTIIASVQKRILAFIIDLLIFFFLILTPFLSNYYSISGIPIDKVGVDELLNNTQLYAIVSAGDFTSYSIFLFYLAGSELLLKATIGKRMLNLSVISKKGKDLSLMQLITRNISKSIAFFLLPFDAVLMFFDPEHRRVSDFISSTLVVENRKLIKKFPVVNEL
ncbi:MAG: RDD family protein [Nanoarchaeota archaeon]|nr:RDD family protein [Nanoarchaeota archaeon]